MMIRRLKWCSEITMNSVSLPHISSINYMNWKMWVIKDLVSDDELQPLLRTYDYGIIAFSVTGRGLLSGKITSDTKFNDNVLDQ